MPLVSICVATFNGEKHLRQCLASALAQTFTDFELLVVDDHSMDGSVAVAEEFAARDKRVRIIRSDRNVGMVTNWNRAVEQAGGEWIKFLFQDDVLVAECVAALLARAREHRTGFSACFRNILVEPGTPESSLRLYRNNVAQIKFLYKEAILPPEAVARFATRNVGINFVGEPAVTLLHRDVFRKVGKFDPAIIQRVDTEFWARAGLISGIAMERKVLASFRVHSGSASATNYARRQFADNYLDTLVIFHRYIHDPAYELLRRVTERDGLMGQVVDVFTKMRDEAASIVQKADGERRELLHGEWERVIEVYPEISDNQGGLAVP